MIVTDFNKDKIKWVFVFCFSLLPWVIMAIILFPRLWFASENLRMVEVTPFGRDEGFMSNRMWEGWQAGAPIFFSGYGFLYNNVGWMISKFLSVIIPITPQVLIIVMRGISLLSFILIVILSYSFLMKKFGWLHALIYSLLFFILLRDQDLTLRITTAQPDLLNLLAINMVFFSLLSLVEKYTIKRLIFVSFLMGMLMAIKFSSVLLLPFIFIVLLGYSVNKKIDTTLVISSLTTIFNRLLRLVLITLVLVFFVEMLVPTAASDGKLIGLTRIYDLWLFQMLLSSAAFLFISVIILQFLQAHRSLNDKLKGIMFLFSSAFFSLLIFSLSFLLFSSKSLYRLNFIDLLFHQVDYYKYFSPNFVSKVFAIFPEGLGLVSTTLFILGSLVLIARFLSGKKNPREKYYRISLIWSWLLIFFFLLIANRLETRYLYILYPPAIFIAAEFILFLFNFMSGNSSKNYHQLSRSFIIITLLFLLMSSYKIITTQKYINQRLYDCSECLPGIEVGRWLEKNFPNSTKIMQDEQEYIPYHFQNILMLSAGDPISQMRKFNPDIILLQGKHIRYIASLEDDEYDNVYFIKSKYQKRFYSLLLDNKLPYRLVSTFGTKINNDDILVFSIKKL